MEKTDKNKEVEDLLDIDKIDEDTFKIEDVNIMFLDVSSTCIGYTIAKVNFMNKQSRITDTGCIWLDNSKWRNRHGKWDHKKKYNYMYHAIVTYFWIVKEVDHIVVEQYSVNPKKMMGVNIVSEMQGAIKCAAEENGVGVTSMLPQTWKSILKIKPIVTIDKNGKKTKNHKGPIKDKVTEYVTLPDTVISNITNKERNTPSDLYDSVGIGLAWLKKANFKIKFEKELNVNPHIGIAI